MSDLEIIEKLETQGIVFNEKESDSTGYYELKNGFVTKLIINHISLNNDTINLIFDLTNLKTLAITNSNLTTIPIEISNLIHLKELDLSENSLKKIPDSLYSLISLKSINFSSNQIKNISKNILKLKNLESLNLTKNKIDKIPQSILELEKLLSIKYKTKINTNTRKIPAELPSIFSIFSNKQKEEREEEPKEEFQNTNIYTVFPFYTFSLNNNPIMINNNLKEIEKLNPKELISYLLSIQEKDSQPLNEAKILVLGDERVGKTSIINRIVGNEFETNQTSTQGIDIQNYYLSNDIKVNIWDFAGQEITHQTHQFFLSTRSLYLFVLDAQKEDNDSAIYDWLEVIKSNGGNSPVIIVANKYDLNRGYSFDINRYKKDFPNIIDIVNVSAKDNVNIDTLVESVEKHISELNHVKDVLPKDWLEVKNALEQLSKEDTDYIEGGKFDEICEENSINEELYQQILLTILHEIGTVVRYENSKLNSVQIINPLWVTNAVYKIIRSEFLNQDAILHKKIFFKIFENDKRYKVRHYQWIMDLLVQFELAFRLDENRVLIPSKLPNNEPNFDIVPFQQGLNLRYKYEGRLKKSFISQFMVKMSDEIDMSLNISYWQRGVFLKYGNCKAVVISEEEKKTITISINTQDIQGREFLSNIRREFKKINKSIEVEEEVPLILDGKIVGFADYENLVLEEQDEETYSRFKVKVDGESKSHRFKISDLLYGYEMVDESEIIDTPPLIITEGKTDWKHLKKALERFQKGGLYKDLNIQFQEYEDTDMGDGELDRMVQTYCKTKQSRKYIFMFDRDNNTYVKKYAKEKFNNHENNVYSFCIPKINDELDRICIEFYYRKEDLIRKDENGKRIFLGDEFLPNGNSKCGKYITEKRKVKELDILDRDKKVYLRDDIEWKNNIALSKNDFTENIIKDEDGFNNFDIEHFKLIFDVIEEICK